MCHGNWLTDDTLDKLLESSGTNADPKGKNQHGKDDDNGRIGGFLQGIFD